MTEKKIIIDSTKREFFHPLFSGRHHYYVGNGVLTKEGFIYQRRNIGVEDERINICLIKKGECKPPTKKQWAGLVSLVVGNCRRFDIPVSEIYSYDELKGEKSYGKYTIQIGNLIAEVREKVGIKEDDIVRKNTRMRDIKRYGGMGYLEIHESIGGTAGPRSTATNFHYDKGTGEIMYFGNWQSVPKNIRSNFPIGTFVIGAERESGLSIKEIQASHASEKARKILEEFAMDYNEIKKREFDDIAEKGKI